MERVGEARRLDQGVRSLVEALDEPMSKLGPSGTGECESFGNESFHMRVHGLPLAD